MTPLKGEQLAVVDESFLLMDRAYEDDTTDELAVRYGFMTVVPPKKNRKNLWNYDKEMYKRHNCRKIIQAHKTLSKSVHALRKARRNVYSFHYYRPNY